MADETDDDDLSQMEGETEAGDDTEAGTDGDEGLEGLEKVSIYLTRHSPPFLQPTTLWI